MKQLSVLPPVAYTEPAPWAPGQTLQNWLEPRSLELTYTAWDLQSFARDCGHDGPPLRWDTARRFLLRCELDAAFFHLYGIGRDDAGYIMDTFPVVRRKDEQDHGEYRTKRMILEIYDALAEAARIGQPYETRLDPPPADLRVAHAIQHTVRSLTRKGIEQGRVSFYILLLLRAWNKPVAREVLDAAIVLMLNDEARRTILGQQLSARQRTRLDRPPVTIVGLDRLLETMQASRSIVIDTMQDKQVVRLGPKAPPTDGAPPEDAGRVKEALRAIAELGEERVRLEIEEAVDESFELVS